MDRREFLKRSGKFTAVFTAVAALYSLPEPPPRSVIGSDAKHYHEFSLHDEFGDEVVGGGYNRVLGNVVWIEPDKIVAVLDGHFSNLPKVKIGYLGISNASTGQLLKLSRLPMFLSADVGDSASASYEMTIEEWRNDED